MANNKKPNNDKWNALMFISAKFIDTGYGGMLLFVFAVVGLTVALTYGMSSADRLSLILTVVRSGIFAFGGWGVAIAVVVVARLMLTRQRAVYERALAKADEVKEKALATSRQDPAEPSLKLDSPPTPIN